MKIKQAKGNWKNKAVKEAFGLYIQITPEFIEDFKKLKADKKTEVRIKFADKVKHITFEEFLDRLGFNL